MDIDEDDDFYAPEEPDVSAVEAPPAPVEGQTESKHEAQDDDLEEGEEEDEGGEMMDEEDDSVRADSLFSRTDLISAIGPRV